MKKSAKILNPNASQAWLHHKQKSGNAEGEHINLAYVSDDGFCRYMLVSIVSLFLNNPLDQFVFHILSDGISEEHKSRIRADVEKSGGELCFYELKYLEKKLKKRVKGLDSGNFPPIVLARLMLPSILAPDIKKVLYIDSDTLVLSSVRQLYDCPLLNKAAAMAPEPSIYPDIKKNIGLSPQAPYFNSGVILFNLSLWRELNLEEECFSYLRERGGSLPFIDQDVLNHVLRGRVVPLSQRYNFFSNYYYFHYRALVENSPWYRRIVTEEGFKNSRKKPVIIHYAGAERPWIRGNFNPYRKHYNSYLERISLFQNNNRLSFPSEKESSIKGSEFSMLCYHIMNLLTYAFPPSRKLISKLYYRIKIRPKIESNKSNNLNKSNKINDLDDSNNSYTGISKHTDSQNDSQNDNQNDNLKPPVLAVVLLMYNDWAHTKSQIERLRSFDILSHIVLVDNCSTDGSREELIRFQKNLNDRREIREINKGDKGQERKDRSSDIYFEKLVTVFSDKNGGYGYGNNLGIRFAIKELKADYVVVANPDAHFSESCLKVMLSVFSKAPNIGVSSVIMNDLHYSNDSTNNTNNINNTNNTNNLSKGTQETAWPLRPWFLELCRSGPIFSRLFKPFIRYNEAYYKGKAAVRVGAVHGSLLMISAKAYLASGGYDENIFLYGEENILGRRMEQAGYKTVLCLNDNYFHENSGSISRSIKEMTQRQKLRQRSERYYYRNYLHISPFKDLITGIFQRVVLLETWGAETLYRLFS